MNSSSESFSETTQGSDHLVTKTDKNSQIQEHKFKNFQINIPPNKSKIIIYIFQVDPITNNAYIIKLQLIINSNCNLWIYVNRRSGSYMYVPQHKIMNGMIVSFNKIKRTYFSLATVRPDRIFVYKEKKIEPKFSSRIIVL